MSRWEKPQDEKYLGLVDWQFDLAVFTVVGAVVLAFLYFGGVGAVKEIINDEPSSYRAAATTAGPVASSVARAPAQSAVEPASDGGQLDAAALTLDDIAMASDGTVTFDIFTYPDTIHARFVYAVYDEVGLYTPLGLTDKNLVVYALATCQDASAPLPSEWEPSPGDTQTEVVFFAEAAKRLAQYHLCRR